MGDLFGPECIASSSDINPPSSTSVRRAKFSCRPTPISLRTRTRSSAPPANSMPCGRVCKRVTFTLNELAEMSGGELIGDGAQVITGAASLPEARAGDVTFFADPRYMTQLRKTQASAAFVPVDFAESISPAQIRVPHPGKAFEQVVLKLAPEPVRFAPGIHPTAVVAGDATIDPSASIQPLAVIEAGATIGANTVIGANSYI